MSAPHARYRATITVTGLGFEDGLEMAVDANPKGTVGDFREALVGHRSGAGKFLTIWDGRAQLPEGAPLRDLQLVEGQCVELVADGGQPDAPVLAPDDDYRLVVEQGPQAGTAWPVRVDRTRHLALDDDGYWTSTSAEEAALSVEVTAGLVRCTRGPGLSARHQLVADRPFVQDTFLDGAVITVAPSAVADDATRTAAVSVLRILDRVDHDDQRNQHGRVAFRIRPRTEDPCLYDAVKFVLGSHPSGTAPRLDFVTTSVQVMPSIAMVAIMSLATTFRPYYLAIPLVQVTVTSFLHLRSTEKAKAEFRKARTDWLKSAEDKTAGLRAQVEREVARLRARNASVHDLLADAADRTGELWRRPKDDADFLVVNLGVGDYESQSQLVVPDNLPRTTRARWQETAAETRMAKDVPVEHTLADSHLAIVGPDSDVSRLVTKVALDVLLSQSPSQVTVVSMLPKSSTYDLAWMKSFPHLTHRQTGWLGPRFLTGRAAVRRSLTANREHGTGEVCQALDEHVVVLVDDRSGVSVADLSEIVSTSDGHVHVIWTGRSRGSVPGRMISSWVEVADDVATVHPQARQRLTVTTPPTAAQLELLARAVRPLSDEVESGRGVSSIPDDVPIGGLVDLASPLNWRSSAAEELILDFLVDGHGVHTIDLVEEGPHILVGGMSGAGKSEFLRALIASAVVRYSPRELGILLVDYKSGASLRPFRDLPHRVGAVTNQGSDDVERVLLFLREELNRREKLFADYDGELKEYRRRGPRGTAPPRLLVVFDEFASFLSEGSKREAEIIALATKGRSLGLHLILATQSPASAITQQIRDNVGARFALKTSTAAASERILERGDAASIPPSAKGRLFVRKADGTVVQLQSAHTQGRVFAQREADELVNVWPADSPQRPARAGEADDDRDLAVLVDTVTSWGKELS